MIRLSFVLPGFVFLFAGPVLAGTCQPGTSDWTFSGLSNFSKGKYHKNVSGIACGPGSGDGSSFCVLVQDEDSEILTGTLKDHAFDFRNKAALLSDGELDAEAVAIHDGMYYVTGSHGPKAKSCKPNPPAANIARVKLDGAGAPEVPSALSTRLYAIISAQPELKAYAGQCLGTVDPEDKKGEWHPARGVNIEGLAIAGDQAYFGFRGPVLGDGTAYVMSVGLAALFDDPAPAADAKVYPIKLGDNRGIRDMVSMGGSFLLLTGSQDDDKGGAAIFSWAAGEAPKEICTLDKATFSDKPEALLVLPLNDGKTHLMVMSDGAEDGAPREIVISP